MPEVDQEGEAVDHDVPADLVEVHEAIEWIEATKGLEDPEEPTPDEDEDDEG